MRAVLQRVKKASVTISGEIVAKIQSGIVVLLGVDKEDDETHFNYILQKTVDLRIFEDDLGKMNHTLRDLDYDLLIVPNFTIYADARKGKRPSFNSKTTVQEAEQVFNKFIEYSKSFYPKVQTGVFRADMEVELINDGPVTIILDSNKII